MIVILKSFISLTITISALPTLLNFEKEKGKFEKLEETNIKLLGQLASYEKEIIQYHSSARKEKLDANTQTADLDISPEKYEAIIFLRKRCIALKQLVINQKRCLNF